MISKSNSLYFLCDMKKHISLLESLKVEDRLKSVKETEFHFKVCKEQLPIIKQNLNKSYITMKNNLYKLHILQVMIEDWEKKGKMCYDSSNLLPKEKLTHYEFNMRKQELKIEATRRKIAFDDLLDHTLFQYNMYKRFLITYEEEKENFEEFLDTMKKIEKFMRDTFDNQNANLEKVNEQQTIQFLSTDKLNEEKYDISGRISEIENVYTNDKSCITKKNEEVINTKSKTPKIKNKIKFHSKTKWMKRIKLKNDTIITEFKKSNLNSKSTNIHKQGNEYKKIKSDLSFKEPNLKDVSQEKDDEKVLDIIQNNDCFPKKTEVVKNEHSEKQEEFVIQSTNNFEMSNFSKSFEEHNNKLQEIDNLQEKKDLRLKRKTNLKQFFNNDSQYFEKNPGGCYFSSDNETVFLESNQSNSKRKYNTYKNKHKFSNYVNKFLFGYPYSLKERSTNETLLHNNSENTWRNNSFYSDKERDTSHLFVMDIDSNSIYLDENKIYQKKKENQYKYDRNFPKIINTDETNNNETQSILDDEKRKEMFDKIKAKKYKEMKCEEENRLILKKRYLEEIKAKDENRDLIKNSNEKQAYNKSRYDPEHKDTNTEKDNRKIEEGTIKRNKIIYDYRKLLKENQVSNILSDPYDKNKIRISKSTERDYDKQYTKESNSGEIRSNDLDNNLNFEILDLDLKYGLSKEYKSQDDSPFDDNDYIQKIDKSNSVENKETEKSKKSVEEILVGVNEIKTLDDEAEKIKDQKRVDKPKVINNIDEPTKSNTKSTTKQEKMSLEEISNTLDIQESQKNLNPQTDNKIEDDVDIFQEFIDQSPAQEDIIRVICNEQEVEVVQDESDKIQSSESSDDQKPLEEEMCNSKLWKKNCYFAKPSNLFEKKLVCIIRAKPGNIPKRKNLKCELIPASEELPYLDKREDYASYCFRLSPRYSDLMLKFEVPWYLSIPFYPLISKDKKPVIMAKNDDLNKWIECVTNEVTFDQMKQDLSFVETRISKPYGTFAVVSSLNKETAIITKEGSQLTCMSDRNVFLSVPPDSLKISINTSLQVSSIDPIFWKEMKEKHAKSPLDQINFASAIVEIEAKKKKLMCAATLTVGLPIDTTKYLDNIQKNKTKEVEPENNKTEDDKSILPKKELNPFQKTLLMSIVSSTNQIQDLHLLYYINEEDRWNISKHNNLTFDSNKNQVSLELPILQTSKFILLKSQKHTNEETITKAAKIIENEFCVRNCVIALFQSTNTINEFAFIVSLKKCFQNNSRVLQDEGYVLDSNNKLTYVELQERQIITTKFVGNIQNIKPKYNETIFCFHSLFPNIQKFKVQEIDSYAQRAVLTFRGYINLYTTSLVKKPIQSTDNKTRKNQIQYTWVEENVMICHLLISISKKKLPPITPFHDFQFKFKNYKNCFTLIRIISTKIGLNWWDLGFHLGIPETRMQSIRLQSQDKGLHKMAEVMLTFWLKGCETYENKYELLKVALKSCGRSDIIDRILKPEDSNLIFGC